MVEFRLGLPGGASYGAEAMGHFLKTCFDAGPASLGQHPAGSSLPHCPSPLPPVATILLSGLMGLEIIGTESVVWVQLVCQEADG